MTEREEDRRAVAALVHRLRAVHGDTDPLGADAEPFAVEYVAALRGFGWRPVCVLPAVADWKRKPDAFDPDRAPRGAALARELLANRPAAAGQGTAETGTERESQ
jgi:hypothetical protein